MKNENDTYSGSVNQAAWKLVASLIYSSATGLLKKKLRKETKTDLRNLTLSSVAKNTQIFDAPSSVLVIKGTEDCRIERRPGKRLDGQT